MVTETSNLDHKCKKTLGICQQSPLGSSSPLLPQSLKLWANWSSNSSLTFRHYYFTAPSSGYDVTNLAIFIKHSQRCCLCCFVGSTYTHQNGSYNSGRRAEKDWYQNGCRSCFSNKCHFVLLHILQRNDGITLFIDVDPNLKFKDFYKFQSIYSHKQTLMFHLLKIQ